MTDRSRQDRDAAPVTDSPETQPPDNAVPPDTDEQVITESSGLERVVVPHQRPTGQVESGDLGNVRAKQVTMTQSGAEHIDAESVSISAGGARSIKATTVDMRNSGTMTVNADQVSLTQSSTMVASAQRIQLTESAAFMANAGEVHMEGASRTGVLIAGDVESTGDVTIGFGVMGNLKAGGDIKVLIDSRAAIALGAGLAVTLTLLRRVFGR